MRTRPIVLTAGTVVIGAFVILFDPIFQGLAVALIAGSVASTRAHPGRRARHLLPAAS